MTTYSRADYETAVTAIQAKTALRPEIGLVLGSGLGTLVDSLADKTIIPYDEIPGWPPATVEGHHGNLVVGILEDQPVVVQQGRAHFYEGYTMQQVTFPIRVMHFMGVKTLMLTNAAGGLNPDYRTGDLMLLKDHINVPGLSGENPLMGPNDSSLGPRFVSMTQTYDAEMRQRARQVATEADIPLHEGVYIGLSGPAFETPAEVRMLRIWGADAVGMSTVNEVLVARHMGMRVCACSGITNEAVHEVDSDRVTSHDEVLEAGKVIVPRMTALLRGILKAYQS